MVDGRLVAHRDELKQLISVRPLIDWINARGTARLAIKAEWRMSVLLRASRSTPTLDPRAHYGGNDVVGVGEPLEGRISLVDCLLVSV
jgi:hypothetical protein